ncbi:MAG: type I-B CRISPR-associated protein Cas5 [Candidatus Cloacimonetes bacterium]|nr:type I-B CRISPR-associated protein Cas5 [Candidatus Cloacimonadota bacterium]
MKVYRIQISSWTASFRFPNMISGFQPTLPVPPLSTINGLISAAKGEYFHITDEKIGLVCMYKGKNVDLETIYQMNNTLNGIKSNVIKREFLCDVDLYIYTDNQDIADAFGHPEYQLVLGRSNDIASVREISSFETEGKKVLENICGTIIPLSVKMLPGIIQALPTHFTDTIPRQNMGTKPYCILEEKKNRNISLEAEGFFDEKHQWDVYWQQI